MYPMYRGSLQKNSEWPPNIQLSDNLPTPPRMPPGRTGRSISVALCAQAFALQVEGFPVTRIKEITELAMSAIYHIKPHIDTVLELEGGKIIAQVG
jgi:hypothetical protein